MRLQIGVTDDIAACQALRRAVFIEEQRVSTAEELDGLDDQALHFLAWIDGRPVGTARVLRRGDMAKIGRVCVLAGQRGTGLGRALMMGVLDHLRSLPGLRRAKLGSQVHALGFYEALGFQAYGPVYLDAGIEHRDMGLDLG